MIEYTPADQIDDYFLFKNYQMNSFLNIAIVISHYLKEIIIYWQHAFSRDPKRKIFNFIYFQSITTLSIRILDRLQIYCYSIPKFLGNTNFILMLDFIMRFMIFVMIEDSLNSQIFLMNNDLSWQEQNNQFLTRNSLSGLQVRKCNRQLDDILNMLHNQQIDLNNEIKSCFTFHNIFGSPQQTFPTFLNCFISFVSIRFFSPFWIIKIEFSLVDFDQKMIFWEQFTKYSYCKRFDELQTIDNSY
ncbi:unnamed protein product (macronuclear) [Paramecium tetraurelia]|uniref:Transmembrane protein n=1 Tax=Paramecium tetraurelia TaxID=5888 RepID=A0DKJ3_PARTE|nr:uncharacterized protein GSPATT00017890001 [Paramecium tetraurelia]CAK83560.1 unnamed protein product [Paramecium tetraurelia]|eukprot:XP_001450957.1 hypothetical protein (macronuclear) [Paramecium tetraurelia strain d4-2]